MKKIISFITNTLKAFGDFFQDRFSFLSETKIWAMIFVLVIPVGAFLLPSFDFIMAGLFLAFAISLITGSFAGDHIAPLANLKGMGILDLVTNKANKLDAGRILGHVVFILVLSYVFGPLWLPEISVKSEMVGLFGTTGVAVFTSAPHTDAKAVAKAKSVPEATSESEK